MTTRLRSNIVKGKKQYSCEGCRRKIEPGELSQINVYIYEGQIQQYRFCIDCEAIFSKHRNYLMGGEETFEFGFIKDRMTELGIKNNGDFMKYLDEKNKDALYPLIVK